MTNTQMLVAMLRDELILNEDLRKAFVASIESALKECKPYMKEHDIAEKIMERIIG